MSSDLPIGIFDSGVGGLTVFNEISLQLPKENVVYLADSANFPYGEKSAKDIFRFSIENAEFLLKKKIKLLLIACHSASSYSLEYLRHALSIPVISISECGYQTIIQTTKTNKIAILGTKATIASCTIESQLKKLNPNLEIISIACPLFAPIVEEEKQTDPTTEITAKNYLEPLFNTPVDVVFLACTHYPLLSSILQKILGPHVTLIHPETCIVSEIKNVLQKTNGLNETNIAPIHQFYATKAPNKFQKLAKIFTSIQIGEVNLAKK